ncbi:MAG: hypothetical protein MJ249_09565 [Kiritimatiellae bacterium]|nr:hypothetical protein [Kiritimatiellia bacterium]
MEFSLKNAVLCGLAVATFSAASEPQVAIPETFAEVAKTAIERDTAGTDPAQKIKFVPQKRKMQTYPARGSVPVDFARGSVPVDFITLF